VSVEAMAIALHHSQADQATHRLVLLGIANHAGDGGAWPSVSTLAHYASVDDRTVQRAIQALVKLGEIRVGYQEGGHAGMRPERRPNLYHFQLRCPRNCDRSSSHNLVCVDCETDLGRKLGRRALRCAECQATVDNTGDMVSPGDTGVTQTVLPTKPVDKTPSVSNAGACENGHALVAWSSDTTERRAWCAYGCKSVVA
jgi:hypothetical protein